MQERRTLGYLKEDDIPSSAVKCEFNVGENSGNIVYSGNVVYVPIQRNMPMFKMTYTNPNYNIQYGIRIASPNENYVTNKDFPQTAVGYGDFYTSEPYYSGIYEGYKITVKGYTVSLVPCIHNNNAPSTNPNRFQNIGVLGSYIKLTFNSTINVRLGNYSIYGSNYGNLPIGSISDYDYPIYIDTEEE